MSDKPERKCAGLREAAQVEGSLREVLTLEDAAKFWRDAFKA